MDETATRGTGCRLPVKHATRQPRIRAGGLVRRDRAIRQSPWTTAASDAYVASGDAIKFVVAQNFGIEFGLGPGCVKTQTLDLRVEFPSRLRRRGNQSHW